MGTSEIRNQPPPLVDYDVFGADAALTEALARYAPDHADRLHALGRLAGSAEALAAGTHADTHPPVLRTHDRYGHRIDEVEFHPAWHWLLTQATAAGLHATPWTAAPGTGAHAARAAGFLVWSQAEAGHGCPVSMTHAAVPALRTEPAVAGFWEPRLTATGYDPRTTDPAMKTTALAGMAMTEKQGGSDVRAATTSAVPVGEGWYALTGHKWFCSAPMNDVFLVLAQAERGLTCFALPRVLPGGDRNAVRLVRLKDKLGNRSNASAEIELDDALAQRVGDEGRGIATIIEMVAATRLDCVLGSAALLRRAVAEATWHAAHRRAFGALLADQPVMQAVLADLAVESEGATALGLRLAATMDRPDDPHEAALRRIGLPLAKLWVCKRAVTAVGEALECLGGNGYVEESGLPRLYRETPVNAIWEGSGNVQVLDLLRVLGREPAAVQAFREEVEAAGLHDRLAAVDPALAKAVADPTSVGAGGRRLAAAMAALLQAAVLVRTAPPAVADAAVARLDAPGGLVGALPAGLDLAACVRRATPADVDV